LLQPAHVRLLLALVRRAAPGFINLLLQSIHLLLVPELIDLLVAAELIQLLLLAKLILPLLDGRERIDRRAREPGRQRSAQDSERDRMTLPHERILP
jgi:hypothetical protein